jgi:hypothetical protein
VEIVSTLVLAVAITWTIGQILSVRAKLRNGSTVVPPFVASTFVFALFIVLVIVIGASPFHLLWLFPLSFVLGIVWLFFPVGTKLTLTFLVILAGLKSSHDRHSR